MLLGFMVMVIGVFLISLHGIIFEFGDHPCSGEGIYNNRTLGLLKFLKVCMVLGMGSVFSKSIANKMGVRKGRQNNHENEQM